MKILVVDDEKTLVKGIKFNLENEGYQVECAYDGAAAVELARNNKYDLLILDEEGIRIVKHIRERCKPIPAIILAAQREVEDRINGLNAGADYYLEKPFDSRELIACINSLLPRQSNQTEGLTCGNTTMDMETCMLVCGGKTVRLSAREFDVMRLLLQSQKKVIPKDRIRARGWGYDSNAVDNHVEVYVGFLRKRLASIGSNVRIVALRRLGYQLQIQNIQENAPSNPS